MTMDGNLLNDRYRIKRILGEGGMSKVYLAENIKLGSLWAIKEIRKKTESGIDLLAEPNILKNLDHPALPRVFDIFENEDHIFIVVDYIEGITLDAKLAASGAFPESMVAGWAMELCNVLQYLHGHKPNPIIYRDMKPSNIIVSKSGNLKLIDFGIAREYKSSSSNDTVYIGTRGYAAPEQYGSGQTSFAADIYSLGVTLHQLLTGKSPNEPPYEIRPVRDYNQSISTDMERIIRKCTKSEPNERYQSVNELMTDLKSLEPGIPHSVPDNQIPDSARFRSFKKLVITVWDNFEFGCELAYMAARTTKHNVLLADLDLMAPKADLCLNLKKYPVRFSGSGQIMKTGLDIITDAADRNYLSPEMIAEASVKRRDLKNLFVLTGNYKMENYEYYSEDSLIKFIEKAYAGFDITILLVNRSIYDSFTVISMLKSDFNIAAIRPDLDKLREINSYLAFLKDKQQMPLEKTKFVAFEYESAAGLGWNMLKEATQNNVIGKISYSAKRKAYRNLKASYPAKMEKKIIYEYESILGYFNIIPAAGFFNKFLKKIRLILDRSSAGAGIPRAGRLGA